MTLTVDLHQHVIPDLGNVVFGTDYPYPPDAISIAGLRQLESTLELPMTAAADRVGLFDEERLSAPPRAQRPPTRNRAARPSGRT